MLSNIPINRVSTKNKYNGVPVVVYDYYVMNQYDYYIPDILEWIVSRKEYRKQLKTIQQGLTFHPNIVGFFNLYKLKTSGRHVIGIYVHDKQLPLSAYIKRVKRFVSECANMSNVICYLAFNEVCYDKQEITASQTIFKNELDTHQVVYFNHLQGNGYLYSVMNILCLQGVDSLVTSLTDDDNSSPLRMYTLLKNQSVIDLEKRSPT